MIINANTNSSFPSQVVPDAEKMSYEYGLKVAQAIEYEWFRGPVGRGGDRFNSNYNNFHKLRLYARGEQSIQKYKDELSINGDLSYLNLDWKPVPVIPKFVDILVNGLSQRSYEIKAYAQDPISTKERTDYAQSILTDMAAKQYILKVKELTGKDISKGPIGPNVPTKPEDLDVHMQLDYKQSIEVAEEEAINFVLDKNKYDLTRRRLNYDLTVLGIAATKTCWNRSEGITVDYVDPASLVYSYTEDPNFEDIYYVGEVKPITIAEIKKIYPYLTLQDLEEIQKYPGNSNYTRNWNGRQDNDTIQVLFFEYKTYTNQVFKIKKNDQGLEKALEKQDTFLEAPETENFKKAYRSIEVLYSGAKILGHDKMLDWAPSINITRPESDLCKVNMNYSIVAPRMYKGKIDSLVNRVTTFADMIQLTHLKLQQVMSRVVPDGVFVDMDGLTEVDLGNGTSYNPAEALNMYFQTGSIVGRSFTQDGTGNPGKVPIQELATSNGMQKISALIQTYQYYLQMIRDVTGLNEAKDASSPDKNALVGLQKLAAANSNTATRHVLQSSLYLTLRTCENISLRIADSINFPTTYSALINSLSKYNSETLSELQKVNVHDFGIFLNLEPDEEEKQLLEQNIQMALQQNQIYLENAIEVREIKNLKLANRMLKKFREKKQAQEQAAQQQNIQAQQQAQAKTAEQTALAETQKQQVLTEQKIQLEQSKSEFDIKKLQMEAELKKQLMEQEFNYNMELAKIAANAKQQSENTKEDRKDQRTRIQATQQSEMINQRKNDGSAMNFENNQAAPSNFESMGNDNLGNMGLDQFEPQ
tara:strand:- start:665 stop:3112 length:2448 start_codon:yes stop_codon:yes gene_type:complete